ncbi:uncharacterized protein LOC107271249 isoform X2 [Cephus cinctus]|uniref:Uncharacterized protein LOC107271249 isoform X2 n=1 Tax=Cephus cinctus TaxID=211228 RepID=A0AAJ7C5S5_CEPCN|nr:uncharacterized protein LOC107271249 isoform X2 [Cephus cinctus]
MRCRLLPGTIFLLLVTLTIGEIEYYPDVLPESPKDITLKQVARYLEAQSHQQHYYPRLPTHFKSRNHKEHLLELLREKEKNILDDLTEKSHIIDVLQNQLKELDYQQQIQKNNFFNDLAPRNERQRAFYELESIPRQFPNNYGNFRIPILEKPSENGLNFENTERNYPVVNVPIAPVSHKQERYLNRGMKEEPFSIFPGRHVQFHKDLSGDNVDDSIVNRETTEPIVQFTFKFDDSNLADKDPIAVKPNDPRYYQDNPFSTVDRSTNDPVKVIESHEEANENSPKTKELVPEQNAYGNKFQDINSGMMPEPQRRAEHDPLVLPVDHQINSDIFIIATVAGCSAAAMFALVLISLTWCRLILPRLQRGAKAAADIEYPAYGVTGPNKDISPSGDQRLAQSAQMYHFQHQKQQIIAMENRTAASRDPGSVSEAESEEENEEGDYTVYECPGLAPTGEMEVKNPLFHDDPTPATPAQNNQQGDH